jgi:ATP synthase protein I
MGKKPKTSSEELSDFDRRLSTSKKSIEDKDRQLAGNGSAYSFGFRLVTDLVVGVLSGFGMGWLLDYWLGTSPWFLLILLPFGIVAGILNVIRAAKSVEAQRHLEKTDGTGIPSVPFDDDE